MNNMNTYSGFWWSDQIDLKYNFSCLASVSYTKLSVI